MPTLDSAEAQAFVKMILIGDSGTGKTGALGSLVKADFRLSVLDFDNKLAGGILPILLKRDCPDKLKNVEFVALRDDLKATAGGVIVEGVPQAWAKALGLVEKWTDGSSPKGWNDQKRVLVLDSLTFASDAAFNWIRAMNPSAKDPRQWFYTAQQGIEALLAYLTSYKFQSHVIVISHVNWMNRPDGTMKGYPSAVGTALGPTIPAYFESMALCQTVAGKRQIQTVPTALVDLKNPAAFKMAPALPIETGLADFFKTLRS